MALQKWILVFIVLFMSGMYFTGRMDRIPRAAIKVTKAIGDPDSTAVKTWVVEQSDDDVYGFCEQDNFPQCDWPAANRSRPDPHRGLFTSFLLDPLFLDRPPPAL